MPSTRNENKFVPAIVIGAGISGLTLVYRLQQLGIAALLIDQGKHVGGFIRTHRLDGFLSEAGPNGFLARDHDDPIMQLLTQLQLQDELITANPLQKNRFIFHDGKLNPVPMSPLALLRTPLINAMTLLSAIGEVWRPRAARDGELYTIDESLADFMRRRFGNQLGQQLVENLIDPMVTGIYAGNAEALSAAAAFPKLKELEWQYGSLLRAMLSKIAQSIGKKTRPRPVLRSLRSGMQTLPQRLVEKLSPQHLHLQTMVESISFNATDQHYSVTARHNGVLREWQTPNLIIATSPKAAATLAANFAEPLAATLRKIPLASLISVSLGFSQTDIPMPLNGYGFLVTKKSPLQLLGSIWASALFTERAPQGNALLTCMLGGTRHPEVVNYNDDELLHLLRQELQTTMGIKAAPNYLSINRWADAIPQYNVGHQRLCHELQSLLKAFPGLNFTGNYIDGISVTHCVERTMQLAEKIALEAIRGTGDYYRRRTLRTDGGDLHGAR